MVAALALTMAIADPATYLLPVATTMSKLWPENRTVTVVCHGHSVPAGYFKTPVVDTFNAYPHLLHVGLKERFPYAVVNVVVTAIGGENSIQGAKRFDADVLPLKPDVVTIDYGLNDRGIPMEATKKAWTEMVRKCQHKGIKVLLLTPSPDQSAKIFDEHDPLSLQTAQIRQIANDTGVGLVDVYHRFQDLVRGGAELPAYMSQVNHPNRKGHEEITAMLLPWFLTPKPPK